MCWEPELLPAAGQRYDILVRNSPVCRTDKWRPTQPQMLVEKANGDAAATLWRAMPAMAMLAPAPRQVWKSLLETARLGRFGSLGTLYRHSTSASDACGGLW